MAAQEESIETDPASPITGNEAIDAQIRSLVEAAGAERSANTRELIFELIATALRLVRDGAPRGDLKLMSASLKEFRYADLIFRPYEGIRKVSIFGSARTEEGDANYIQAKDFAHEITKRGWMVITGAGPGIMAAGNEGAGPERSFGLRIRLPFEPGANPTLVRDKKLINFKYFFTRKVTFIKESHAFVMLPGGFGTLDEAFELLTLIQTGRSDMHPIVLLETPGGTYWKTWLEFMKSEVAARGLISEDDLWIFKVADDIQTAVDEIESFYFNYHSERYVSRRLILRLHHAPDAERLAELNDEFADIVTKGSIEVIPPTRAEIADDDFLELDRVALWFDRRSYARLRKLINALNE